MNKVLNHINFIILTTVTDSALSHHSHCFAPVDWTKRVWLVAHKYLLHQHTCYKMCSYLFHCFHSITMHGDLFSQMFFFWRLISLSLFYFLPKSIHSFWHTSLHLIGGTICTYVFRMFATYSSLLSETPLLNCDFLVFANLESIINASLNQRIAFIDQKSYRCLRIVDKRLPWQTFSLEILYFWESWDSLRSLFQKCEKVTKTAKLRLVCREFDIAHEYILLKKSSCICSQMRSLHHEYLDEALSKYRSVHCVLHCCINHSFKRS